MTASNSYIQSWRSGDTESEEFPHTSPDEETGHQICWILRRAGQDRLTCLPT